MMSRDMAEKELAKLKKALVGWTVSNVTLNTSPEGMITLVMKKDGQKRSVHLWATDLGWWHKATKTKGKSKPKTEAQKSFDLYLENPLSDPEAWKILPPLRTDEKWKLIPRKGITLDRQARTKWNGVMIYEEHYEGLPPGTGPFVAFFGSIWGSGSKVTFMMFGDDIDPLIKRVEADPNFQDLQARLEVPMDPRVTLEWEDAP